MACCFLMAGHEVDFSMAFRSRYTYRLLMHFYHPLFPHLQLLCDKFSPISELLSATMSRPTEQDAL